MQSLLEDKDNFFYNHLVIPNILITKETNLNCYIKI